MRYVRRNAAVGVILTLSAVRPAAQSPGASPLEGPTWRLVSLPGQSSQALRALRPGPSLRLLAGRVTGFTGCNVMTGTYTTEGTSVSFNLTQTTMACPEPASSIERAFVQALKGTFSYAVTAERLTLTAASGTVLEFEPEPTGGLEGRTWIVTGYNNGRQAVVTPILDTQLTISFDGATISGHAGCNTFRATYSVQDNRVTIGPARTTRKMCSAAVMAQERDFLKALQSVDRWAIEGGLLDMHRADDERALTARPSETK